MQHNLPALYPFNHIQMLTEAQSQQYYDGYCQFFFSQFLYRVGQKYPLVVSTLAWSSKERLLR